VAVPTDDRLGHEASAQSITRTTMTTIPATAAAISARTSGAIPVCFTLQAGFIWELRSASCEPSYPLIVRDFPRRRQPRLWPSVRSRGGAQLPEYAPLIELRSSPERLPEKARRIPYDRTTQGSSNSAGHAMRAVVALLPLAAVVAACGGGGGGSAASTATTRTAVPATTTTRTTGTTAKTRTMGTQGTTGTESTTATTQTTTMSSTTGTSTGATTVRTTIGNLIASPDNVRCAYVPHGSLSGADQLTVFFYILLIGASTSQLPRLVAVNATSDTGLSASLRTAVTNQGATPVQLDLRQSDFGRAHAITITVDGPDEVHETDEGDNRIRASVRLPAPRPDRTIADLPCSAARA
jgi:hypothetical protein